MTPKLKDNYTQSFIKGLATEVKKHYSKFNVDTFIKLIFDSSWRDKELKERMRHIARCLQSSLPGNYKKAVKILMEVAPGASNLSKHSGYLCLFFPDFVELYGQEDWDTSMLALEEFTKYSSSEFAVRPFIISNNKKMMEQMKQWAKHENYHVRRLASEGCRPRLPWAMALPKFKNNPSPILPILRCLKDDEEEYVRRSVANNLNDIAKDNPEIVIEIAQKWIGKTRNGDRLVKHACRTLLKAANKDALALFGFGNTGSVKVSKLGTDKKSIEMGDSLYFSCEVDVLQEGRLRIEYAVDFMKANGKQSSKIFQIKEGCYSKEKLSIKKKHSFRDMTTRKHYPGKHTIAIVVNGERTAATSFLLN